MTKKQIRAKIKQDLLEQLERNVTTGQYYKDLVEDYMQMWDMNHSQVSRHKKAQFL